METPEQPDLAPRRLPTVAGVLLAVAGLAVASIAFSAEGKQSRPASPPLSALLPNGAGLQDPQNPNYTDDTSDPYPMPTELLHVKLMEQTADEAMAKSVGCINCHTGSKDPHFKDTVKLGCTDCHGGDASCNTKEGAHVAARFPQFWPTAGNPVRTYTLLNHESPAFIRFVNPGDFRIAHISCGTAGCHPREVQTNRKSMMSTGCMLWGAAMYNNGSVPNKRARYGEQYSMVGAPLRLITNPPPTVEEATKKGVVPFLDPLPRYEMSQPGNVLRIFEPGGRFNIEVGIPERLEEPGRPRTRLSIRGLGTLNRTDPVTIGLNKTRLFDPTLNFLGTNDHAGDYRSSGCSACHVVYANDRSKVHSGQYAQFGNRGLTSPHNPDPTIPKDEPGHPIEHRFTNAIPTSQCMVCHVHPGTTVMNSYIGYMWYDEETHAELMYPPKQKNPTSEQMVRSMLHNPDETAARGNWTDHAFLNDIIGLNPQMDKQQFGDFHSHGWVFKAVFKKDRKGHLLDYAGNFVGPPTPAKLAAGVDFPVAAKEFHKKNRFETAKAAKEAEDKFNCQRAGHAVHMLDIHMEKGMHCVDCHFVQDNHGNNRLQMEVRAAVEIACIDCHGTASQYASLKTSGVASYTSAPDGNGRNLAGMRTPFGAPRFEVEDLPDGKRRYFQNSMVEKGVRWEVVQVKDTVTYGHPRYNEKSALAKTVRVENGRMVWGDLPAGGEDCTAHKNSNMTCQACHTSWNPSCYGCHLPQRANLKMPNLHNDGDVTRNYTSYNFQTLRDDIFMLARDGDATGNRINPSRSSCTVHVGSYNGNREAIYVQQQTVSGDGYAGTAFSTNVPHTVRGSGVRETKQCTDCHLSQKNDNNAIMAQLLMQGTQYTNFVGKYAWIAAGHEGLFAPIVTETSEPQAVIGSELHKFSYPANFKKHVAAHGFLKDYHEHPGFDVLKGLLKPLKQSEVLQVQPRGEFLYAACGEFGVRAFDISFIDHKGFAERITTAPVSPVGQQFYVKTKNARYVAAPCTPAVDPTRKMHPENKEQPIHGLFAYLYVADAEEGMILIGAGSLLDGNPVNNFFKRELTYNPDGLLKGAKYIQIVGTYAYVCCDAGLVVIDIDKPTEPKVTCVVGESFLNGPKCVQVQFRYAYVVDCDGVKVLDVTDLAVPVAKSLIRMPDCHSIYLARTYAYVAAGKHGLAILDITDAEHPKVDQMFTAGGCINDCKDVKLAITYTSQFAYLADGKNGMRVVQLTSPSTPGNEGFSPRPTPLLVATFKLPHEGEVISVAKGLDRDRAVDESGNQIGVFGRVGARPLNKAEQRKMYLRDGKPWFVSDHPRDPVYTRWPALPPPPAVPPGK